MFGSNYREKFLWYNLLFGTFHLCIAVVQAIVANTYSDRDLSSRFGSFVLFRMEIDTNPLSFAVVMHMCSSLFHFLFAVLRNYILTKHIEQTRTNPFRWVRHMICDSFAVVLAMFLLGVHDVIPIALTYIAIVECFALNMYQDLSIFKTVDVDLLFNPQLFSFIALMVFNIFGIGRAVDKIFTDPYHNYEYFMAVVTLYLFLFVFYIQKLQLNNIHDYSETEEGETPHEGSGEMSTKEFQAMDEDQNSEQQAVKFELYYYMYSFLLESVASWTTVVAVLNVIN